MRARVEYWLAPGLRSIEMTAADYVAQRFSRHWHTGFAVGVVTCHAQGFHADGREWVVTPNHLIVLNPGQIHDGYSLDPAGWSSRMAYIPETVFAALAGARDPKLFFPMRFADAVVHSPTLARDFLQWHCLSQSVCELRSQPLTAKVFACLRNLMRADTPVLPSMSSLDAAGELRKRLFALASRGDASAASLSADLDLSRSGSWRRVKNELGLAPKAMLSHLRLMSAKKMLVQGSPVIEAALDNGYHDQSHFSRQFAAAYGFTPAQFRRAQLGPCSEPAP